MTSNLHELVGGGLGSLLNAHVFTLLGNVRPLSPLIYSQDLWEAEAMKAFRLRMLMVEQGWHTDARRIYLYDP